MYSTWPCAHASTPPLRWLSLTHELSALPDADAPPSEPLTLRLSLELSSAEDLPREAAAPLPLQLAFALGTTAPAISPPRLSETELLGGLEPRPGFYAVHINRQDFGVARLLRLRDGRWFARREDLEAWRLHVPAVTPLVYDGEAHYPLDAYEGATFRFDEALQSLDIEIASGYFSATVVEGMPVQAAKPTRPGTGAFFNYDLFASSVSDSKQVGGLFEAAFFNRLGVGVTSMVASNTGGESHFVRLDTTWRRDFPEKTRSLLIGDAIGSSGVWGRPVRFGGLRYGTNFATNPGFITFPLPGFRGEAALPTTTDLYVDGVLRQSSSVPPGPFRINNLPVVTGQGEVRLVVRDLLGREQVISLPYYASSQVLREGLRDDSYEIGVVRNNYGIRSDDYGRFVSAIQRRKGFSDTFTGEARAELLRDQQTGGIGGSLVAPALGVFTAGTALSHSEPGNGALLFTGFERQAQRGISFGARSQWTTQHFMQLGLQPDQRAPVRLMSANAGMASHSYGSIGVAYVREVNRDRADVDVVSASYTVSLGKSSALVIFGFKPLSGEGTHAIGVTLSMGLGERTSGTVNVNAQPHANQATVQVQQNLPPGPGTGYRLLAGGGSQGDREEAGFSWQTHSGTYVVEAGRADNVTGLRASAAGGIALVDGRPHLARSLTDSFAVAHVPGYSGVGIYLNNQIIARTDTQGYAMVPRLLPYQVNTVRIDTADLPLDVQIDATQIDAVPYYRSGLLLRFPVQRANGALLVIVLDDGTPLPLGSLVSVDGKPERFPVAQRGEAYVTGLASKNHLRATWDDRSCEFDVTIDTQAGPLPRIAVTCRGVKP